MSDVDSQATATAESFVHSARFPVSGRVRGRPWLVGLLDVIETGTLDVHLSNGKMFRLGEACAGNGVSLWLKRPARLARRVLMHGEMGFHEGYIEGDWDAPDLPRLLGLLAANAEAIERRLEGIGAVRLLQRLRHRGNSNTRRGSRRNIAAHYDLGNDFFARWLDEGMTYSSALFDGSAARIENLPAAQDAKYARMLDLVNAEPGQHILEIGCGWGGFAEYAAGQGMRITGITLSQQQFDFATARIRERGLADRVELVLMDYRDLPERFPEGFDHVVSIEMFEAVGEKWWDEYFRVVRRMTRPGGHASLQVITIDEARFETYREQPDFIQSFVFPGGMLPSKERFAQAAQASGLGVSKLDAFGNDYAETLRLWREVFMKKNSELRGHGHPESFLRLWHYYLAYCETGFALGMTDLVQVRLSPQH